MSVSRLQQEAELLHIVHDVLGFDLRSNPLHKARYYTLAGIALFGISLLVSLGLSVIDWSMAPVSPSLSRFAEGNGGLILGIAISTGILSLFFWIFSISEIQRTLNLHEWIAARYVLAMEQADAEDWGESRHDESRRGAAGEPQKQPRLPLAG